MPIGTRHTIDPNFKQGGSLGVIEQLDLTTSYPQTVAILDGSGNQITSFAGGGTQYADGAVRGTATGILVMGDDGTNIQSIKVDSSGDLQVDVLTMPTVAVTGTFYQATQPVSLASVPSHAVTNAGTFAVQATLQASTNTQEIVGDVAHDAAAGGNPVLVAGIAQNADDTAPPNRVTTEADATRLATDFDGAVFVRTHGPQVWSYHVDGSSALTDASVHAAPGAGLSLYVTSITFSSGAATAINAFFEEATTTVLGPYYLEAVAGRGMHLTFPTPKKITANTALTVTTSASIAHSIDVMGYTAQG